MLKLVKLLGKVLLGLVVAVVLAVVAAAGYRAWQQHQSEKLLAIDVPNGVDEQLYVDIDGSEQWITIRGRDKANPVLFVVHGGPGVALSPLPASFLAFERDYVVVQWDQPGAARTLSRAGGRIPSALTTADVAVVGVAVVEKIRSRLGKPNVILVGLSWGSAVGIDMVRLRPDLFSAYVGTGLFVNKDASAAVAYDNLLARARAEGNAESVAELVAIGPPPHDGPAKARVQSKWALALPGEPSSSDAAIERLRLLLLAPRYGLADVKAYFDGYLLSDDRIDLGAVDLRAGGLDFEVPMFAIQGVDDYITPVQLARSYFGTLRAPHVELMTIGGGHTALVEHADEFITALNEHVRPLAVNASSATR
jgi:pimeloyl-ACP methyl ester carboxylesterase